MALTAEQKRIAERTKRVGLIKLTDSDADIDRALLAVAINTENFTAAAKMLRRERADVTAAKLRGIVERHRDRYMQIRSERQTSVFMQLATDAENMARKLNEAEQALIDHAMTGIGELDAAQALRALHSLAVAKGIQIDKALTLRGRPTQIVEQRDLTEILRSLAAHPGVTVHSPLIAASPDPDRPLEPGARVEAETPPEPDPEPTPVPKRPVRGLLEAGPLNGGQRVQQGKRRLDAAYEELVLGS